jgi:CBS domain-containing membrane protein
MRQKDVVHGLLHRLELHHLKKYHDNKLINALFVFINGSLSVGIIGLFAHLTRSPFLFPSIGPTAFLLFYRPLSAAASPKNAILGHLIGILAGWAGFMIFGVEGEGIILKNSVSWDVVGASALAISLTFSAMVLLNVPHPPVGSTTLVISLGIISNPAQFPILLGGVVLLCLQAYLINRLAGLPYPIWAPRKKKTKH